MTDRERQHERRGPQTRRRSSVRGRTTPFYADALAADERVDLAVASEVHGLEQEIALLRLWLRRILADRPEDFGTAVKAISLLVRAVSAAGRLSVADDALLDRVSAELNDVLAALAGETGE
jgi:hypothetical protein